MNNKKNQLLAGFLALALLCTLLPSFTVSAQAAERYVLPVFETSDVHGFLVDTAHDDPAEYQYRLAYIADKVDDARAGDAGRTVLLDGGDIYQGNAVSNLQNGQPMVAAFDAMEYDAVGLGNHEFDWGVTNTTDPDGTMPSYELGGVTYDSQIPVVCCNLYYAGGGRVNFTQDYVILDKTATGADGSTLEVKVAVIGYVTNYASSIKASEIAPYSINASTAAVTNTAKALKASGQADAVIVLAHADASGLASQLGSSSGVDLVCGGHTHVTQSGTSSGLAYIQPENQAAVYAYAELSFDADKGVQVTEAKTVSVTGNTSLLLDTPENAENLAPDVLALSHAYVDAVEEALTLPLGYITTSVTKSGIDSNPMSSTAGNWITDLTNRATGAQVSFTNDGGIRTEFIVTEDSRTVTRGDVYTISPFGNLLYVYDVTYRDLAEVLTFAISSGRGLQLRMSGIDCYYTSGQLSALVLDGLCIYKNGAWETGWADKILRIATNEYVATASNTPFSAWNDTDKLVSNVLVDNEAFIEVLESEGAEGSGLLAVDTQAHMIYGTYAGDINRTYTVTTSCNEGGTVTPTQTVPAGSNVEILITPAQGYKITDVIVDGISKGPLPSFTFGNLQRNHTLQAVFSEDLVYYTVTTSCSEGGTVTPTQTVPAGSEVTLAFAANAGYDITDVIVDGVSRGVLYEVTISDIQSDHTVYVVFTSKAVDPCAAFADIDRSAWYHSAIDYVLTEKLFSGTGTATFAPETAMTRGMLVTVLYNREGAPETPYKQIFADVSGTAWYTPGVIWAASQGIVSGRGDGCFHPNDPLTRQELAVILRNYAIWRGDEAAEQADLSQYSDAGEVADWAKTAVSWTNAIGILSGRLNGGITLLAPLGNTSRAECASILWRLFTR